MKWTVWFIRFNILNSATERNGKQKNLREAFPNITGLIFVFIY